MPLYENIFLVRPEASTSQIEILTDEFNAVVVEAGGTVSKVEQWGLRSLAYKIKKNRKAHYVYRNLSASAETVHEMERNMRIHEDVLRYLTVKVEAFDELDSPIMQSRGARDDRDRTINLNERDQSSENAVNVKEESLLEVENERSDSKDQDPTAALQGDSKNE